MSHWHPPIETAEQTRVHHERWLRSHSPSNIVVLRRRGEAQALQIDQSTEWCNESYVALGQSERNT